MKRFAQNRHFYILIILLGVVLTSCVKEMDFDGIKDVQLTPKMNIDLMEAEITTAEVVAMIDAEAERNGVPGPPYPSIIYTSEFKEDSISAPVDITSEERITKYLDSTSIEFKFTNTTPRDIVVEVELLMEGGQVDSFNRILPRYTEEPVMVKSEFYESDEINKIKKLNEVKINLTMNRGIDIKENPYGKFALSATGTFNFEYDVSNGLP